MYKRSIDACFRPDADEPAEPALIRCASFRDHRIVIQFNFLKEVLLEKAFPESAQFVRIVSPDSRQTLGHRRRKLEERGSEAAVPGRRFEALRLTDS
jgi:hypothetical protein